MSRWVCHECSSPDQPPKNCTQDGVHKIPGKVSGNDVKFCVATWVRTLNEAGMFFDGEFVPGTNWECTKCIVPTKDGANMIPCDDDVWKIPGKVGETRVLCCLNGWAYIINEAGMEVDLQKMLRADKFRKTA